MATAQDIVKMAREERHSSDGQSLLASHSTLWALFHEVLGRQACCIERSQAAATTQPANATHSISQPLPNRSCIDHAVRAGGATGKNHDIPHPTPPSAGCRAR